VRTDIDTITGPCAYFEQGTDVYQLISNLRNMQHYAELYSNIDLYAVPPGNVKFIKARGAMDMNEVIQYRVNEVIAASERLEKRYFYEQMESRKLTPVLVEEILGIPLTSDLHEMFKAANSTYFRYPAHEHAHTCMPFKDKITELRTKFAAKYAGLFAQIDQKIATNRLLFRAICAVEGDSEVTQYLKSFME
jgi:hypothetical protein